MYVGPCPESPLCQWFKAKKMNPSEVGKSIMHWSSAGSLVRVRRVFSCFLLKGICGTPPVVNEKVGH